MNSDFVSALASVASAVFTLIGIYYAVSIYKKGNRTTLLLKAYELIQSEKCVNSRKSIFESIYDNIMYHKYLKDGLSEVEILSKMKLSSEKLNALKQSKDKSDFNNWDIELDSKAAEEVCRSFDLVGVILKDDSRGLNFFSNYWSEAIEKSYFTCKPLIDFRRKKQNSPLFWNMFEEMYKIAIRRMKTLEA